jgi:hypothetical protein
MKALLFSLVTLASAHAAFASCGTFEVSKGDVKTQSPSGSVVAATVGSKICSGDTVISADSSRAKIKMEDGNELNISPNSKIVIETYQYDVASNKKKVLLNILKGKVRATTREENMYTDKAKDGQANTFQVRTKSAVAGVRGTDFLTGFDPKTKRTEVITFRGKVEVGLPGPGGTIVNSVSVVVGQRTQVLPGQPRPELPKALPAGELMKQNNESHNESPNGNAGSSPATTPAKEGNGSKDAAKGDTPRDRQPASSVAGPTLITAGDLPATSTSADLMSGPKTILAPTPLIPVLPAALINNPLINNAIANKRVNLTVDLHIK